MRARKKMSVTNITEGVIWKQLLMFFFPILLGTFFQQMYNTIDTIIVGRFVGTNALAAVGASGALTGVLVGFFTGLASGATVVVSQRCGAGDGEGVSKAVHTGMALAIASGIMITMLGLLFGPSVLKLTNTPEAVFDDAKLYTLVYFAGGIALVVYNVGSGIMRALGDSKRPMIYLMICCVVNIVLDLFCIVVLKLGVAGAALATTASQIVSAILVVIHLMRLDGEAKLHLRQIRFDRSILSAILKIGIPSGLQSTMYSVSNLIIQSGINSFGSVTAAAWTAHDRMCSINWMVVSAFGVAITTFVGQNFGAQKYDRVRKSVRVCMGMALVTIGLLAVVTIVFGRPILGIFTSDPEVIDMGMKVVWYINPFYIMYVPIEVFSGAMRGTGDSVMPTIITCVGVCLLRVVWIFGVVSIWNSVMMLALAYGVTWTVTSTVFAIYYLQGGWLRKRIKAMGFAPEEK